MCGGGVVNIQLEFPQFVTTSSEFTIRLSVSKDFKHYLTAFIENSTHYTIRESFLLKSKELRALVVGYFCSAWHGAMEGDLEKWRDEIRGL